MVSWMEPWGAEVQVISKPTSVVAFAATVTSDQLIADRVWEGPTASL